MQNRNAKLRPISLGFLFLFLVFSFCILSFVPQRALAGSSSNFRIEILTLCGNNLQETGEQCDGSDLNGASCTSQGYASGNLSCNSNCTFNTSSCASGGGGGGGGGSYTPPAPSVTAVIFSGRAYPLSKVGVLKDGQLAITTVAGPDSNFNISLTGLSSGNYIFAVSGEDNEGRRSALFTFPVFITQGATTQVSGIFIAPTIAIDKSEVKQGDQIAIFGQSTPNSEVTIAVNSDEEFFNKTKSDQNGAYLYNFDTTPLTTGQHLTRSKSAYNGEISSFSKSIGFIVGTKNVVATLPQVLKYDLSEDGRVNLVDFSIVAYWYKRSSPPADIDLNGDSVIDLIDFSIMAFYWTG
ncbi:MAG: hypothetical protein A3H06_01760 [Candidatus Colwellbacteria bacterium RIFCSPLOWO2_12_FULL_44_13]|uniref:Dockerin domain-containing protein n=3 Tax=Candidatus Colwelliibacteriota TaxID=1817904 RepID=A0A1G1ZAH8_9BACT|nr:MAG: hypothetical protein A3F24_00360 [Candidatus Colwellbacteria bacterium RIFCSPHIGHO2_12_FULL_44_17]OGY60627.1 MAG: hypothetical protein A3I31_00915 [Candidatus Colwellbacteria bacterium RIFCSPLOWO2_02_FULL_44_20b]OGY61895.1 MAG: hypothetical protein A3H06_01760 [Candidatus Colwellbacteria bacterium RIFCSPLOWO2_12_FULL_44_13]